MRTGTVAFLIGVLWALGLEGLPDPRWYLALPVSLALAWACPRSRPPALLVAGLLWTGLRGGLALEGALPPALEGADLIVIGTVADVPERTGGALRLDFRVEEVAGGTRGWRLPVTVRLQDYGRGPVFVPGERWRLAVRLKRPRGSSNPGGFDYEAWLLAHRIRATGYLRPGPETARLSPARAFPVARLRAHLAERMASVLGDHPQRGVIAGLVIGLTGGLEREQWAVFRATGTTHLMAISGSHVVLVAGVAYFLGRWLWALAGPLPLWLAAQRAAALAAALAAWGYAALAGMSVPTERAAVMVTAAVLARAWRGTLAPSHGLALGLLAVLVHDPLAPLSPGLWLSFLAVAVLLLAAGDNPLGGRVWGRWGLPHLRLAVGLLPLTLAFFGESPWLGPLANLVAVPWIGLVVVPLALVGAALVLVAPAAGGVVLGLAADAAGVLWPLLERVAALGWVLSPARAPGWIVTAAATLGALLLTLPRGIPARWVGALWLAPILVPAPGPRPAPGEAWVTVLDVGQGLAVVVETAAHTLLYDAGPRYRSGGDAGESVVVPFLRTRGRSSLDRLVLSHGDDDHVGGAASVVRAIPTAGILGPPLASGPAASPCVAGTGWDWDGVGFRVLHPEAAYADPGNDASCVLQVSGAGWSVLLPGDLEARGEAALLARSPADLRADVLVVPHHGSGSSSTPAFVAAVSPGHALIASGYRNRFRFPAPAVVARFQAAGTTLHDTARDGAVTVRLGASRSPVVTHYRVVERRFWHTPIE